MDLPTPTPNPVCVINCAWYGAEGRRQDVSLDQLSDLLDAQAPGFAWVGLYEPSDEVLLKLQEELDLHPLFGSQDQGASRRRQLIQPLEVEPRALVAQREVDPGPCLWAFGGRLKSLVGQGMRHAIMEDVRP